MRRENGFYRELKEEQEEIVGRNKIRIEELEGILEINPEYRELQECISKIEKAKQLIEYPRNKLQEKVEKFTMRHIPNEIFNIDYEVNTGTSSREHNEYMRYGLREYQNQEGNPTGIYGLKTEERCSCGFNNRIEVFQPEKDSLISKLTMDLKQKKREKEKFYLPEEGLDILFRRDCGYRHQIGNDPMWGYLVGDKDEKALIALL